MILFFYGEELVYTESIVYVALVGFEVLHHSKKKREKEIKLCAV